MAQIRQSKVNWKVKCKRELKYKKKLKRKDKTRVNKRKILSSKLAFQDSHVHLQKLSQNYFLVLFFQLHIILYLPNSKFQIPFHCLVSCPKKISQYICTHACIYNCHSTASKPKPFCFIFTLLIWTFSHSNLAADFDRREHFQGKIFHCILFSDAKGKFLKHKKQILLFLDFHMYPVN